MGARGGGAVIAMTITLAAVYAPIGLMFRINRCMFKEFAITLAGSVIVSGIVALTLSPVMSSLMLKPKKMKQWLKSHEYYLDKLAYYYSYLLNFCLTRRCVKRRFRLAVFVSLPFLSGQTNEELAPLEIKRAF
ncbi:efflux RND transporter permease subunit [Enterobacter hormaechei]